MRPLLIVAALLALAGCVRPTVTGASSDEIIIKHDPALQGAADLQAQADSECGRYGKKAQFRKNVMEAPLGLRYAHFDCVSPSS